MVEPLTTRQKISLVLFMVGKLLEMDLRLKLPEAIGKVWNARLVALRLL